MKKAILTFLLVLLTAFGGTTFALSAEKEAQIQTATETIMDYLLIHPQGTATSMLLLLKDYQQQFAAAGEADKLYIVTSILDQLKPFVTCVFSKGTWLVEVRECENIPAPTCASMGGEFDECASSCRHSDSIVCTLACVPVCSMDTLIENLPEITTLTTVEVGSQLQACPNAVYPDQQCRAIRPQGQVGWTLTPQPIINFNRAPGFRSTVAVFARNDGNYLWSSTLSQTIDLMACGSYFDGCNTCTVSNGQLGACTRKYCSEPEAPRCLDLINS